jgi:uncharacterized glyoxalase superfamily protein PhnB
MATGVPSGHNAVSPYLVVADVPALLDFLRVVFGAEEIARLPGPGGAVSHAETRIGDSVVMMGGPPSGAAKVAMVHVYVADVDATYARALEAGAKSLRAPEDMFYGDRISMVSDPSGNTWAISTHKEDVSAEEMARRAAAQKK